ncbi:HvfB family MNIO-type RiPP peptide maturase [Pseudoxanthomonas sp. 10H]|uniref:HvfB family MNIO-type RiPP peptide maturase n=1 Tax=Pseudoxanthomonas sp. 10H TaxID=3242729 RepID=UPI003557C13C
MTLPPASAGLGLRRAMLDELRAAPGGAFDFLECAPDNWIGVGGRFGEALDELAARHPLSCHGLSLSLGGTRPLDEVFLARTRRFLDRHRVALYSEHLSSCTDDGHLYDLMPIPFTAEAVRHVAARIRRVQDVLGRRIAVENVSYYAAHPPLAGTAPMAEAEFVAAVVEEADCDLLLDVNNVYVNAINHGYDPAAFLARMPTRRIASYHVAGHYDEAADLKVDTHGAPVKGDVWALLADAYRLHGVRPTLLERDFNLPPLAELLGEVARIRELQAQATGPVAATGRAHE